MNNTIFDDVFRTMIEKMPYLAVPLINEVFHTSYLQIPAHLTTHSAKSRSVFPDITERVSASADQ